MSDYCPICGGPCIGAVGPRKEHVMVDESEVSHLRSRAEAAEARALAAERMAEELSKAPAADSTWRCHRCDDSQARAIAAEAQVREQESWLEEGKRGRAFLHEDYGRKLLAAEADVAALRDRVASLEAQVERLKEMEQALCTCRGPDEGDTLCCVHFQKTGVRPRERLDGAYERIVALTKDNERAAAEIETWKGTAREYNELANLQEECAAQAVEGHRKTAEQTATHFSERWRQAHERAEVAEAQVEVMRGALEDVVDHHGHMVHGQDCPIRLCESGDCEHTDETDCDRHEDECECCLGVAFVASRALSPDAPTKLLDRLRLAEAVVWAARDYRTILDAEEYENSQDMLGALMTALAAYDKQGDAK